MNTTLEIVTNIQDQLVDAVKAAREPVVEFVKTASAFVPEFASASALPFADQLPTPDDVVRGSFGFAQRLLEAQADVVLAAANAWQSDAES